MVHKVWKSIDAWRGYYSYEPTIDDVKIGTNEEALLTECHFVPHKDNDKFIELTKDALKKFFNVRVKTGQTSNVFSGNVMIIAKPKGIHKWTPELKKIGKEINDLFVDYYTKGFSIFSGQTYPINLDAYKEKLQKVIK